MWKRYLAVGVGVFLTTAVFMFFYGKQYKEEYEVKIKEREDQNKKYADSIKLNNVRIAELTKQKIALLLQLAKEREDYEKINIKYIEIGDVIRLMPFDAQIRFLAEWLPKEDSLARGYPSSTNSGTGQNNQSGKSRPGQIPRTTSELNQAGKDAGYSYSEARRDHKDSGG